MMEHCTSTHGHGGLGPASSPTAIFVTIPAAVSVEARALAPAVTPSALPVAPPTAAPAPAPKFRPNSFAIVIKCSPFLFYFLIFFQQRTRTRTLFLCSTRTSHTHTPASPSRRHGHFLLAASPPHYSTRTRSGNRAGIGPC